MPDELLKKRPLAGGNSWVLEDVVCSAGPNDRPFEERHDAVSIALVRSGTFQYRTSVGEAMLYPGAFLLGNAAECFECGHTHSRGDRCLALQVPRLLFEQISASTAGSSRFRFHQPMLPARPELSAVTGALERCAMADSAMAADEAVCEVIERLQRAVGARPARLVRPSASELRRLSGVLRHIESNLAEQIELDSLASLAAMSKYHFLRIFARVTGSTPYRYVLTQRLRRAAELLARSLTPVGEVALQSGFTDVSTFNRYFQRMLGKTPSSYRAGFRRPFSAAASRAAPASRGS